MTQNLLEVRPKVGGASGGTGRGRCAGELVVMVVVVVVRGCQSWAPAGTQPQERLPACAGWELEPHLVKDDPPELAKCVGARAPRR